MTIERVLIGLTIVITIVTLVLSIQASRKYEYVVQVKGDEDWVTIVAIGDEILSNASLKVKVLTLYNNEVISTMLSPKAKED